MIEGVTQRIASRGLSDRIRTEQADAQSLTTIKVLLAIRYVASEPQHSGLPSWWGRADCNMCVSAAFRVGALAISSRWRTTITALPTVRMMILNLRRTLGQTLLELLHRTAASTWSRASTGSS